MVFPIKIEAIEKIKRAGDDGKKEKACPARFIFFLPVSARLRAKTASAEDRGESFSSDNVFSITYYRRDH